MVALVLLPEMKDARRMEISIREARPQDAEQLIGHVQRLSEEPNAEITWSPGEFNYTVEQEQEILNQFHQRDNSVYLVAEVDGQIVGIVTLEGGRRKSNRHSAVLGISVRDTWRGKGIGKQLMAQAIEWANQTGMIKRIELLVNVRNTRALHLYQSFGFEIEGRRRNPFYQNGLYHDDYLMALLLA